MAPRRETESSRRNSRTDLIVRLPGNDVIQRATETPPMNSVGHHSPRGRQASAETDDRRTNRTAGFGSVSKAQTFGQSAAATKSSKKLRPDKSGSM